MVWNTNGNRENERETSEHSIALFLLLFGIALGDCASSVLFFPFLAHFSSHYMTALFIGGGMSGFVPSFNLQAPLSYVAIEAQRQRS